MTKIEKIILGSTATLAVGLGITTIIGTVFCTHAAILFAPAFLPIIVFGIYKLVKLNLSKKENSAIR